jgi:hypothetical protein
MNTDLGSVALRINKDFRKVFSIAENTDEITMISKLVQVLRIEVYLFCIFLYLRPSSNFDCNNMRYF